MSDHIQQNKQQDTTKQQKQLNVVDGKSFTPPTPSIQAKLDQSPLMVAQRKRLDQLFNGKSENSANANQPTQLKIEEEKEHIQLKEDPSKKEQEPLQMKINSGGSNKLPDDVQSKMETSFNTDFSDVNIHSNSSNAKDLNALAYTQGSDIHFAPGQYSPESQKGQELLGHELTHVVQQREGRVKPTTQFKTPGVNDDSSLEKEADQMGEKVSESTEGKEANGKSNEVLGVDETEHYAVKTYFVSAYGASYRDDSDKHKVIPGKIIPIGEKVWGMSYTGEGKTKLAKVHIISSGTDVWTSFSNLTEVNVVNDPNEYRVATNNTKTYQNPINRKTVSQTLNQDNYFKIIESCGDYVHLQSTIDAGWILKKQLLLKPKDTSDNFNTFQKVNDWTALDEVDKDTLKQIESNRNAVNDRTDQATYGKGPGGALTKQGTGYVYNGKNLYDPTVTGNSDIDKKVKELIKNEVFKEGGYSSINSWDGQVFTYGKGFAMGGQLTKLIKEICSDEKYKNIFLQAGIGVKDNDIVVVGMDGKVNKNNEQLKDYTAGKIIKGDPRLQSFFIELGEKKEYGQDIANAQLKVLSTGIFNYPKYIVDTNKNDFNGSWDENSVTVLAHLTHWAGAGWNICDYSDTSGDLAKVLYKYFSQSLAKAPGMKSATYSNNVVAWNTDKFKVLDRLGDFGKTKGAGLSKYKETWGDSYLKELEFTAGKVYIKGEKKVVSNAILFHEGTKYRIIVPIGDSLDSHLTEEK